uniref:CCDC92 domain-containing protein n=1 Tax=Strongyloides stercoralis TaxID=6248 RepID=A0A0K0EDN5_STRER
MSTLCSAQNLSQLNYFINSSGLNDFNNIHEDDRIKKRIEACQQGMQQLETLRAKHLKLMDDLRSEYSLLQASINFIPRNKKSIAKPLDIHDNRSQYSASEDGTSVADTSNISHRSSMSVDSGYLSVSTDNTQNLRNSTIIDIPNSDPPMSYNAYRKMSMDENNGNEGNLILRNKPPIGSSNIAMGTVKKLAMSYTKNIQELNKASEIIKTTLEGTTALRPNRTSKSQNRPWSMYSTSTTTNNNNYMNSEISSLDNDIKNNLTFAQTSISQLDDSTKYFTLTKNNVGPQNYNDSHIYSKPNKSKHPVSENNNNKTEEIYCKPIKSTQSENKFFLNVKNKNEKLINRQLFDEEMTRNNNKSRNMKNIQPTTVVITRFSDNLKSPYNNKLPPIPNRSIGTVQGTPIPSKKIRKGWLESEEL